LQQAVRFTGAVDIDQLQNYFLDSTCLVLPSRSEAWGLVVNEALSYGCPVVVSNQCGCAPELVIDGKTGYLFQVGDTDDLYRKMLLAAREMSNAPTVAKDCIELMQSYTPAKAAAKILQGCRSILSGPAANSVFFVGPLPPPLHGFSAINQKMLAHLADTPDVRSFNTVPRLRSSGSPLSAASKAFSRVRSFCSYFFQALARRPSVLYIGLSGGLGQIFDSLYILTARLAGAEVFVHHHSFVYLNSVRPHNRLCMRLAGPASHIVLCDVMARKLAAVYGVPAERISVLSNAAFLDEGKTELPSFGRVHRQDGLTLGFIANITLEKGIVEFFEVVARLVQQGHPVKALVAGPVDPNMQKIFFPMLDNQPAVNYLGPVYGEEKETFFKNIDLLLFPTKYPNEAEPLIILEALRAAVPVIAAGRGCINSLINQQSGVVFPNIDDYVDNATEYVKAVITGEIPLSVLSENAFNQFSAMRIKNMTCINALLARIKRRSLPQPAAKTNLHEI
jgi:glycosyltransferase involved in cell wall biosynthesis